MTRMYGLSHLPSWPQAYRTYDPSTMRIYYREALMRLSICLVGHMPYALGSLRTEHRKVFNLIIA